MKIELSKAINPRTVGSNESFTEVWVEKTQSLRFVLGEFCILDWSFPALVPTFHHTELPGDVDALRLPLDKLPSMVKAVDIPSFPSEEKLSKISFSKNSIRYVPQHFNHYRIEMQGTFDQYLKQLRPKPRHELFRKVHKFAEHYADREAFREFQRQEEMPMFQHLALQVSRKTYQEKLLHVGLPSSEEFLREIEMLADKDLIRGYLLFDGNNPIAYGYCQAQGSILVYIHTGYDPQYREWSPGIVLLYHMLKSAFAEGRFRLLDFGSGESQWKSCYGNKCTRNARILFFRPTFGNLLLVTGHSMTISISDLAVRVIAYLGLKERLKRFFRFRKAAAEQRVRFL